MSNNRSRGRVIYARPVKLVASLHEAAWDRRMISAAAVYRHAVAIDAPHLAAKAKAAAEAAHACASFWKGR